jgi:hypothetical protein
MMKEFKRTMDEERSKLAAKPSQKSVSFKELVACQHSSGFWPETCKQLINNFFKDGSCHDQSLLNELQTLTTSGKKLLSPIGDILMTIIALYVLEEKFEDNEEEWTLLAKKAKAWLKNAGLDKPD